LPAVSRPRVPRPPCNESSPHSPDARSDLYAVGTVGYFLLTGRHVFEGGSIVEVCAAHLYETPVPWSERGAALGPDLEALVLACLAKDPAARPASAAALRDARAGCADAPSWDRRRAVAWWAERPE